MLALLCSLLPYSGSAKLASPAALHLSHPLPSYRHSYQLVAVFINRAALQNLRLTCRLLFDFLFYLFQFPIQSPIFPPSSSANRPSLPLAPSAVPLHRLAQPGRISIQSKLLRAYLVRTLQLLDTSTPLPHLRCVSSCLVSLSRRVALSDVLNQSCSEVRWVT